MPSLPKRGGCELSNLWLLSILAPVIEPLSLGLKRVPADWLGLPSCLLAHFRTYLQPQFSFRTSSDLHSHKSNSCCQSLPWLETQPPTMPTPSPICLVASPVTHLLHSLGPNPWSLQANSSFRDSGLSNPNSPVSASSSFPLLSWPPWLWPWSPSLSLRLYVISYPSNLYWWPDPPCLSSV